MCRPCAWIALTLMTGALMVGCTSLSVHTDHAPDVDFSTFETFHYVDSELNLAQSDPLSHQRVVSLIRSQMTSSGLAEVDSGGDVDVTYYGSIDEHVQFTTTYTTVGGWGRWGGGVSVGGATTRPTTYKRGTLIIDVWSTGDDQLVWRAEVADSLSNNRERNTERINRGVVQAFESFPPG